MSKEVNDLWSRAQRTLRTAKSLIEDDPDSAVSRAYYSAFYATSALFLYKGSSFSKHSALASAVHRDLVKTGTWVQERGADFSFLLRLRATGDYGGSRHVSSEDAKAAVEAAERIIETVHLYDSEAFPVSENNS